MTGDGVFKISGMVVQENMMQWAPLLEEWCLLIERYSRAFEGKEHVFDFGELSNVGILSAAAWRSGFLSLPEFGHSKQKGKDDESDGRCDLWIGSHDLKQEYYVEAKHRFAKIDRKRQDMVELAQKELDVALQDAVSTAACYEEPIGVGVLFISICQDKSKIGGDTEGIESLVEKLKSSQPQLGYDAIAWSFPEEARITEYLEGNNGRLGIFMLVKKEQEKS